MAMNVTSTLIKTYNAGGESGERRKSARWVSFVRAHWFSHCMYSGCTMTMPSLCPASIPRPSRPTRTTSKSQPPSVILPVPYAHRRSTVPIFVLWCPLVKVLSDFTLWGFPVTSNNRAYHLMKDWSILGYRPLIITHYVSSEVFFAILAKTACKNYRRASNNLFYQVLLFTHISKAL